MASPAAINGIRSHVHRAETVMLLSMRCSAVVREHQEQLPRDFLYWMACWQATLGLYAMKTAYIINTVEGRQK